MQHAAINWIGGEKEGALLKAFIKQRRLIDADWSGI